MALRLEDKKALVAEVNDGRADRAVRGRRGVPGAAGRAAHRAACQGPCLPRLHASGEEHAGPPGRRRHSVRVRRREAQGPADPRLLAGRPGRGCAADQGICEGQRQARADARVARRQRAAGQGPRARREPADQGAGARAAARRAQGARSASSCVRSPSLTRSSCARSPRSRTRRARPPEAAAAFDFGYSGIQFFRSYDNGCQQGRDPRRNLQHDRDGDRRSREDDGRQVRRHRRRPVAWSPPAAPPRPPPRLPRSRPSSPSR